MLYAVHALDGRLDEAAVTDVAEDVHGAILRSVEEVSDRTGCRVSVEAVDERIDDALVRVGIGDKVGQDKDHAHLVMIVGM